MNVAPAESVDGRCVHTLVEDRARRSPEALAVSCEGDSATYEQLNGRADRLALRLAALGVGRETVVPILLERGVEAVVAMLAVLKAGGAYLPLDASNPPDRLALILDDGSARVVVTRRELVDRLPERGGTTGAALVLVGEEGDDESLGAPAPGAEVVLAGAEPTSLAYVIYTSGSTGRPKGTMIEHRSLANLVAWHRRFYGVTEADRASQVASLAFDASVWEIWPYLACGASVHVADDVTRADPRLLARWLVDRRITMAFAPTPIGSLLFEEPWPPDAALRRLLVGGDRLATFLPSGLPFRVVNNYGPTEATVVATAGEVAREDGASGPPSIGRAIDGARVYILDARLEPVPVGTEGELFVAGAGVARGYLGKPELTAERFLPDPFAAEPGARMYQTGDRGRWRADGEIDFLGRRDDQVKIRGFRIELGEVESAIAAMDDVREVIVLARDDGSGGSASLVAYVVTSHPTGVSAASLRRALERTLPEHMIPSAFVLLDALPLSPNGKVDRAALPAPDPSIARGSAGFVAPRDRLEETIAGVWREVLGIALVGIDDPFFELGGDSMRVAVACARLGPRVGAEVAVLEMFQYPTIRALAGHLASRATAVADASPVSSPDSGLDRDAGSPRASGGVAIVGMAGRFPGARNVDELWDLLCEGREGISRFTRERLLGAGADARLVDRPEFVPASGLLEGGADFDAAFFNCSPQDARLLDPQQRQFLECAYEAIEQAGYDPARAPGAVGVFAGSGVPRYWLERVLTAEPGSVSSAGYRVALGNPSQFLATQTAFKLGLEGPALTVHTACSTSLVAVHMACQSLTAGECDMALAGGVSLYSLDEAGYVYEAGGILSPDGRCRPFDRDAGGTVPASGCGVVVLKRLEDAVRDGDSVRAVILGSAVNNDGARKVGFTAPSVDGQADVIARALAAAGVGPDTIGYVEAHGTATQLGDPIEVAALTKAFRVGTDRVGYCALGALKGNLGHLDAAAGVAGLIKAALVVERGYVPATPHFRAPNEKLDLDRSPFYVPAEPRAWETDREPRRAGVSAFGIGGTNAHVVLEQAPPSAAPEPSRTAQLLVVSARTSAALAVTSGRLAHRLGEERMPLADAAYTLAVGRRAMAHRRAVVSRTPEAAAEALASPDLDLGDVARQRPPKVVFMFPGAGTQSVDMGRVLYDERPVYRDAFDRCAELFSAELGCDIRAELFASAEGRDAAREQLRRSSLNMATIFATEYSLARQLMAWGVEPSAVVGHSLGEYTAACVAAVLSLEDAVSLVALRGRLCERMPASEMLIVPTPEAALWGRLGDGTDIAAVNSPGHSVVSGASEEIDRLEAELASEGVKTRRLPVALGSHSPLVEPFMDDLAARASTMARSDPAVPIVSTLTGTWLSPEEARDPSHWARHLRQTVRFADAMAALLSDPDHALVEVGPGRTLTTAARLHPACEESRLVVTTMAGPDADQRDDESLLEAVGRLWCAGVDIAWDGLWDGERRRRVPLPGYSFERARYAIERAEAGEAMPDVKPQKVSNEARRVRASIADIWREVLGVDDVRAEDDFFDLGGSSLAAVELCTRVRERLNAHLSVHALLERPTFGDLERAVCPEPDGGQARAGRLLLTVQEGAPGRPALYLVQPIGGTAFTYRGLADHLGPQQPVFAFRSSGIEPGEEVYTDVPTIASHYVEELVGRQPRGPHVLGGHSSGGVIAYEMALQLRAAGHDVAAVVMIDTVTVEESRRLGLDSAEDILRTFEQFEELAPGTWQTFRRTLAENAVFREVVVATNRALRSYEPARSDVNQIYLRARERDAVLDPHAEWWWADRTDGSTTVHNVPGNHFTVMDDPNVADVARVIGRYLDSPRAGRERPDGGAERRVCFERPDGSRLTLEVPDDRVDRLIADFLGG